MLHRSLMEGFLLACLWPLLCGHTAIPTRLWPLTDFTKDKEVLWNKQTEVATFYTSSGDKLITPSYNEGEPGLGYKAFSLDGNFVNVTWAMSEAEVRSYKDEQDHPRMNRMLMALFHWDPRYDADFFDYRASNGFKIHVYSKAGSVYVAGRTGTRVQDIVELGWYTVAIAWKKGDVVVYFVEAIQGKDDGEKRGKVTADHLYTEMIEEPGTLTVGPIPNGAVCCLRWYVEQFDDERIRHSMKENCEEKPSWRSTSVDPCGTRPCKNGGICSPDTATPDKYSCTCRPWYEGPKCENRRKIAKQVFTYVGQISVADVGTTMLMYDRMPVRSRLDCSNRCLWVDMCMSFAYEENRSRCSLYEGIIKGTSLNSGSAKYFVEASQLEGVY